MDPEIQLLCVEDKFVSFLRVDWKEEVEEKEKKTEKKHDVFCGGCAIVNVRELSRIMIKRESERR